MPSDESKSVGSVEQPGEAASTTKPSEVSGTTGIMMGASPTPKAIGTPEPESGIQTTDLRRNQPKLEIPTEGEAAQDKLLYKLEGWLRQQPEWPLLFLADRKLRRRVAKEIAHRIYTIPKFTDEERLYTGEDNR